MLTVNIANLSNDPGVEQLSGNRTLSTARMLWKRRWLALAVWMFVTTGSILIARLLPPIYRAEAVVLVNSQKIPENLVSSTVSGDVTDRLALVTQRIMTSDRLLKIINTFALYREARIPLTEAELLSKMRQDISVNFEKSWTGDRMKAFRLGYQGHNAAVVAEVANRLAGLYVAENVRSREDQAEGTVDFLAGQLRGAKTGLDEQEARVALFKEAHNGSLPEQENSLLATLNSLNMELQGTQTSLARAQENKSTIEAVLAAAELSETAIRANLRRELRGSGSNAVPKPSSATLSAELRVLRQKYTSDHPAVQALENEIAEIKREEAEDQSAANASKSATDEALNPFENSPELVQSKERIAGLRAQIEVAKHQIETLDQQRQQLASAVANCQARINRLPLVEQQMASLKRNYDESATNYNSLLQKTIAAGIATDMEHSQKSEQFTVIDPARAPEKPENSKRVSIAAGGSVGGLVLSLLVGFVLEFRKRQFLGEWELPAGSVVLGRIPVIEIAQSSLTLVCGAAVMVVISPTLRHIILV